MFVRNCILILFIVLSVSCSSKKHLSRTENSFKADIYSCEQQNEIYKLIAKKDSLNDISLRLFTSIGFKIIDATLTNDSVSINSAITENIRDQVSLHLNKYKDQLCLNNLLIDILNGTAFSTPAPCYIIKKNVEVSPKEIYDIYSLNQEILFSIERFNKSKRNYKVFNKQFCIYLNLKD